MSNQNFNLAEELDQIKIDIGYIVADALGKKTLTLSESQDIGEYVLYNTDLVDSSERLLIFLRSLARRWNIFKNLYDKERVKFQGANESDEKIGQVRQQFADLLQSVKK